MKRLTALLLLCCVLFTFASCSQVGTDAGDTYVSGGSGAFVFRDSVYYPDKGTILMQPLDAVLEHGISVDNDPMASVSDRPFGSLMSVLFFCEETKTGDQPRMVLAYTDLQNQTARIAEYDLNTGAFSVLADGIEDMILSLYGYGSHLFYSTSAGDRGFEIFGVDRKTGKTLKMNNPDGELWRIACFAGDRMYYYTDSGELYSCKTDFTDRKLIREGINPGFVPSVSGEYLYFSTQKSNVPFGSTSVTALNLVRASLDDLSTTETVAETVYLGWGRGGSIYYMPVEPVKTDAGKTDYTNNTLCRVGSGEKGTVVFHGEPDAESIWFLSFSDDYAVRRFGNKEFLVIRLSTGESFHVPK